MKKVEAKVIIAEHTTLILEKAQTNFKKKMSQNH